MGQSGLNGNNISEEGSQWLISGQGKNDYFIFEGLNILFTLAQGTQNQQKLIFFSAKYITIISEKICFKISKDKLGLSCAKLKDTNHIVH